MWAPPSSIYYSVTRFEFERGGGRRPEDGVFFFFIRNYERTSSSSYTEIGSAALAANRQNYARARVCVLQYDRVREGGEKGNRFQPVPLRIIAWVRERTYVIR